MNSPIGIFDSGIGGLTVLKEINALLPNENLIYFGDTARVPYGAKSRETVTRFSAEIVEFLISLGVKMIVVACNTSSALALPSLTEKFDIPFIGVIKPGAELAVKTTSTGRIGVIGTHATIGSGAYEKEILRLSPQAQVFSRACPVFVSLVEEGWTEHPATRLIAKEYLNPLLEKEIDTLVLGCTHYPLLKPLIHEITGNKVNIVDSARACSAAVQKALIGKKLSSKSGDSGKIIYYVSDMPEKFEELSSRFLGRHIRNVILHDNSGAIK